jgi:hypothetical protein
MLLGIALYAVFLIWSEFSLTAAPMHRLLAIALLMASLSVVYAKRPLRILSVLLTLALALAGTHNPGARALLLVATALASLDVLYTIEDIETSDWVSGKPAAPQALLPWILITCMLGLLGARFAIAILPACFAFGAVVLLALSRAKRAVLSLATAVRAQAVATIASLGAGIAGLSAAVAGDLATHAFCFCFAISCFATGALLELRPETLSRLVRRLLVTVGIAVPLALLSAFFAASSREVAWLVVPPFTLAALAVGLGSRALERRLLPDRGKLLRTLEHAAARVSKSRPEDAIRTALLALRDPYEPTVRVCTLWTTSPPLRLSVDGAGYLQSKEALLPPGIVARVSAEPRGVLRAEVLEELEIRHADCRPIGLFAKDHDVQAFAVIALDGAPEALLLVPTFGRSEGLTLEEVAAMQELADRLAASVATHSQRSRTFLREQELATRFEKLSDEAAQRNHSDSLVHARHTHATLRLAGPAAIGFYSAPAQLAHRTLQKRMALAATIAVAVPSGADAVPILARTYLEGPKRNAPFVVVDGTSSAEHVLERWQAPSTSPIALSQGGLLCLVDAASLPHSVQDLIAQAHAERRASWESAEAIEFQLVAVLSEPMADVAKRLSPLLSVRLQNALADVVRLPRMRDRPEDLRAIFIERLAREGLRVRGTPIGLHDSALAELINHPFDGEDAELHALTVRLVQGCTGNVVYASDVRALGLIRSEAEPLQTIAS